MIIKNLRGIISFKAVGQKSIDFINDVKNQDIPSFNIKIISNEVFGDVYRKDYKIIKSLAHKNNMDVFVSRKKGFIFSLMKYKKRYGFAAGLLLSLSLIFYLSNIVLKIEIQGNNDLSEAKILECLFESGISYGKFIPDISFKEAERKILTSFDSVSWNSIRHSGGRIVVEIDEAKQPVKIIPENIPCNIVALRDAQIVNTEIYSGIFVRKLGDAVKCGDLLVSGMGTDIHGKSSFFHAYGKITGLYKEKAVFEENLISENITETGESEKKNYLNFFGLEIPLFLSKNEYIICNIEEDINYFEIFGYKTPIGIKKCTYYKCDNQSIELTKDEALKKIDESINTYETDVLKNQKIITKEIQVVVTDGYVKKIVLYEIEGDIGVQKIIAQSDVASVSETAETTSEATQN